MFGLSIKPKCTCRRRDGMHYLNCDLFSKHRTYPKMRKRFFLFYPLVNKR